MPTAPGVPRRSPIQVLTGPNVAWLQWSDENWYVQRGMAVAEGEGQNWAFRTACCRKGELLIGWRSQLTDCSVAALQSRKLKGKPQVEKNRNVVLFLYYLHNNGGALSCNICIYFLSSFSKRKWGVKEMPTALGVPRRSPIQVLTEPNIAWLQWSDENWYFQCGMAVDKGEGPKLGF